MEENGLAGSGNTPKDCKESVAKAIGIMFAGRTVTHILHLKTKIYAEHKALNKFYDEIVDLVDDLAEATQGQYGILDIPFVNAPIPKDSATFLKGQLAELDKVMLGVKEDYLMNIYQEIQKLYRSTLYKLVNLS
jgi:hypothetical protein